MLATAIGFYPTAIERLATSFLIPFHERSEVWFKPVWCHLAFVITALDITHNHGVLVPAFAAIHGRVLVLVPLPSHRKQVTDQLLVMCLDHVLAAQQLGH
jgi:hypothetical protein